MRRLGLVVIAAIAAATQAASGQSIEASASTLTVQSHTRFANAVMEQTGQWVGGSAAVRLGQVRVGLNAAMGSLSGDDDVAHPDRKGRTTNLVFQLAPKPWLAFGASAEARRFDSDVGISVWRLIGGSVSLTPTLVPNVLDADVDVSVGPAATVIEGEKIALAMRTVVGSTYWMAQGRAGVRLAYRFERFDFDGDATTARLEQFRGATLGVVVRLRK
jgi:hypothetical protein